MNFDESRFNFFCESAKNIVILTAYKHNIAADEQVVINERKHLGRYIIYLVRYFTSDEKNND